MNILFPIGATWRRERPLLIVFFCLANLVLGQLGIIWALMVSVKKQIPFAQVLDQNRGHLTRSRESHSAPVKPGK